MANHELVNRWAKESLAMLMIGDACVTLIDPGRHVRLYMQGPKKWRRFLNAFVEHPTTTKVLAVVELGLGIWLAQKQTPVDSDK